MNTVGLVYKHNFLDYLETENRPKVKNIFKKIK